METWAVVFVGIVAFAAVIQTIILIALFVQLRAASKRMEAITRDLSDRAKPVLAKVQALVEEVQPKISTVLTETAEISRLAKAQVQRVDGLLGEASDRLRLQLVHVDQILTGALDSMQDAGSRVRRTVTTPLQTVVAVVRGLQTGIQFYRGAARSNSDGAPETQDESLFI